jgi:hypothetical protein
VIQIFYWQCVFFSALQVYQQTGLTQSQILEKQRADDIAVSGALRHTNTRMIWIQCEQTGQITYIFMYYFHFLRKKHSNSDTYYIYCGQGICHFWYAFSPSYCLITLRFRRNAIWLLSSCANFNLRFLPSQYCYSHTYCIQSRWSGMKWGIMFWLQNCSHRNFDEFLGQKTWWNWRYFLIWNGTFQLWWQIAVSRKNLRFTLIFLWGWDAAALILRCYVS